MARVLGWLWHLVTGLYRLVVVLVLVAVLALLWLSWRGGLPVHVDQNVALVVHPQGTLVDQPSVGSRFLLRLIGSQKPAQQTDLLSLRRAVQAAADDERIGALVLDLDDMGNAGLPQLQELAASVDRFRKTGKPVYAYGESYDQYQYFLAAHANHIALDPMGTVFLQGLGVYGNYFKDALDKLGVQVNVFRVGQYKSAVEPFLRNDMSPAAKLENRAWLGDLWSSYQAQVTANRKLPANAIGNYIDGFSAGLVAAGGNAAEYALKSKLVDAIQTRDAFRKGVAAKVGMDNAIGSFRQISALAYLRANHDAIDRVDRRNRVGLVVVQGDIVDGDSSLDSAGGDTIAALLDQVRQDASVSALVLRVNSPGGSVSAAEKIRRAVLRLKAAGKPVVVSMSTLAASGGYWISMDADHIYAEPTTITGSIGIFGLLPTIDQPLNKLGIHVDGVGTTPLAGAFSIERPLTQPERDIMQSQVNFGYQEFTEGVAKGRGLPLATVQQIAQGRVWSGQEAKKLGLVDAFGGLDAAEAEAAKLAKFEPGSYRLKLFVPQREFLQRVLGQLSVSAHAGLSGWAGLSIADMQWLQPVVHTAHLLRHFNDPKGEYAYCFCTPAVAATVH